MMDFTAIKAGLQERISFLARELAPRGYEDSGNYFALSPLRSDRKIGSFYIGLVERPTFQRGAWIDQSTGEKGDIIDLICAVHGLDKVNGFKWGAEYLGQDFEQKTLPKDSQPVYGAGKKAQTSAEQAASAASWFARAGAIKNTLAETYLSARGIALDVYPPCLRFLDNVKHRDNGVFPCLMTGLTDAHGQVRAVHRTFLRHDGQVKAEVDPPRLVWPSYKGLIMRLHSSDETHDLALVEGVEDGLSIAKAMPQLNVWGAVSISNFQNITLPALLGTVYICADNDSADSDAGRALVKAVAALQPEVNRRGSRLMIVRSPVGKDFNDVY